MSNVVTFPGGRSAPLASSFRNPSFDYGQTAPKTRNRRNPLRQHLDSVSIAIVEANKLEPSVPKWIRQGAQSARALADELSRIADELGV